MNGGQLRLPDRPGLGIELAEEIAERYPYIEGHYALTIDR
jgi:L-alanine-DL-glutamate epimerase-like enolase superfamily enzyme